MLDYEVCDDLDGQVLRITIEKSREFARRINEQVKNVAIRPRRLRFKSKESYVDNEKPVLETPLRTHLRIYKRPGLDEMEADERVEANRALPTDNCHNGKGLAHRRE